MLSVTGLYAQDILQVGQDKKVGYSTVEFDCEIVSFYGSLVKLKTKGEEPDREFFLMDSRLGGQAKSPQESFPLEDATTYKNLFKGAFVEAKHPNGEWYVGVVQEVYGKCVLVKLGEESWSAVWVMGPENLKAELFSLDADIELLNYKKKLVGRINKDGTIWNRKNEVIGKIYSTGKVLDQNGELVGTIKADGSIEKNNKQLYGSKHKYQNGLLYLEGDKPILVLRYKLGSLHHFERQDIIEIFFKESQLKGNFRLCGGIFLLFKDRL